MKRILGVDYGLAYIGLALSDPTNTISSPIGTLSNKGYRRNVAAFSDLVKQHDVGSIVIGLPVNADGSESQMSREVRQFVSLLHEAIGIEIFFVDERYSTLLAKEEIVNKMGIRDSKKISETVDTIAASMILREYLENKDKT